MEGRGAAVARGPADAIARRRPHEKRALCKPTFPQFCSKPIRLRCCAAPFVAVVRTLANAQDRLSEAGSKTARTRLTANRARLYGLPLCRGSINCRSGHFEASKRFSRFFAECARFLPVRKSRSLPQRGFVSMQNTSKFQLNPGVHRRSFGGEIVRKTKVRCTVQTGGLPTAGGCCIRA